MSHTTGVNRPLSEVRVAFMGTPAFALPSLQALEAETTIVAVITQPDRPAGRGRGVVAPAVARYAKERGLPIWQPKGLKSQAALERFLGLAPDLLVTAAYGRIIPAEFLAVPRLGAINVHPSLLPAYRGASPIQRVIADGQRETGITILFQTAQLDAGDIIMQQRVPIGPEETAGELEARLAAMAPRLLLEAVRLVAEERAPRSPQDEGAATYVGKLSKADGRIDWRRGAAAIANQVRAMDPWPSAYTHRGGSLLKIWRAHAAAEATGDTEHITDGASRPEPGTVLRVAEEGILVATGEAVLRVVEVQPEGGRRMSAAAFARGHRVRPGEPWGQ